METTSKTPAAPRSSIQTPSHDGRTVHVSVPSIPTVQVCKAQKVSRKRICIAIFNNEMANPWKISKGTVTNFLIDEKPIWRPVKQQGNIYTWANNSALGSRAQVCWAPKNHRTHATIPSKILGISKAGYTRRIWPRFLEPCTQVVEPKKSPKMFHHVSSASSQSSGSTEILPRLPLALVA